MGTPIISLTYIFVAVKVYVIDIWYKKHFDMVSFDIRLLH